MEAMGGLAFPYSSQSQLLYCMCGSRSVIGTTRFEMASTTSASEFSLRRNKGKSGFHLTAKAPFIVQLYPSAAECM